MASDVSSLHIVIQKAIADKNAVMPTSVRAMIAVPSVLVSVVSVIWLFEHVTAFFR